MMKNSEWGAAVYLAHSKYGRNGTEISINNSSSYYTGRSAGVPGTSSTSTSSEGTYEYNTEKGVLASTTANVYGIYDMSGGALEYTASYISDASSTSYAGELKGESTAYKTLYSGYSETIKGDAVYETSSSSGSWYSWFGDESTFPMLTMNRPFFARGGAFDDGLVAGAFYFSYLILNSGYHDKGGFRPVLAVF